MAVAQAQRPAIATATKEVTVQQSIALTRNLVRAAVSEGDFRAGSKG
jgi:hypothetical protein